MGYCLKAIFIRQPTPDFHKPFISTIFCPVEIGTNCTQLFWAENYNFCLVPEITRIVFYMGTEPPTSLYGVAVLSLTYTDCDNQLLM